MTSTLFSPLSRGCGSWDGDLEPETKQTLARTTSFQPRSPKKDAANYLDKSLSIPLRAKKDDLSLIRDIFQDATTAGPKSPTKTLPTNFVDVLRANTPKPQQTRAKSTTPNRFQPEKPPQNSPPSVRPKTALPTNNSRVQSAASSSLYDRIKSAPARRLRTKTAPPVEKRALIPKTLTTRKGALLLFAAPGDLDVRLPEDRGPYIPLGPPNVSELGARLGTTNKLTASVLQYGNQNFPSDLESFNSQYDKTCMRFVQEDDDDFTLDYRAQPGGDFVFYLRDMQSRQAVQRLVRSPSHHSLSSIDTVEELNDALRSIEIDGIVMGPDGDEVRSQRSTLITADADRLAETMSRASTTGLDPISRPTTGGFSRPSTCKTRLSRPGTSKSMCSTPLSAEKLAASIKSAPYLGHPIQAPYPPSMASIDNYQEEVQSTRTGPGSRPESVNSIRSVTIKSRKSSARSSIRRPGSGISGGMVSEHGDGFDEGSVRIAEGAVSEHEEEVMSDGRRSLSRGASSHHESWHDGGSDAELEEEELLDPSRPNSSRPMSSRRSRQSSARRSASLRDRSKSHVSGAGSAGGDDEEQGDIDIQEDSRNPLSRQHSAKSVAMPTDENWQETGAEDADGVHSSHYGSRPASRRSQFSYASASTSVPMGSEPDLEFPEGNDQQIEEHLDEQQAEGTPVAVTPKDGTPQGTRSKSPRPPSWQQNKSITSDHPPEETTGQEEEEEEDVPPEENIEGVVAEVMREVVDETDEAQDLVIDIDMSNVPKAPRMSVSEAQDDIAAALRRHSHSSSAPDSGLSITEEPEESAIKTPTPPPAADPVVTKPESPPPLPPTVEPLKAPVKEPAPAPKKRVVIAATPIKAKSRSPSPTAKPTVEKKADLSSLVSKGKQQPPRIPPPKKAKSAKKKRSGGGGGGGGRTRSPPPPKMEYIESVVIEQFEEPTEEEFERMLQEELAQELAEKNLTDLIKQDKQEEKPVEEADEVNSLATDDEAIEKQVKETNKGKKKNKKQMAKERAALKEERRQEKLRREEEKKELEAKKKQREAEKRRQEEEDRRRREDLAEQLADAEEEARRAAEAEEEAREMLQESRKLAREEREAKRKADIERKKVEREKQRSARKKMEDAARQREREMAERLASAAERKKMREEAEYEQQEQDRLEREQREYEEEEERLRLQEEEERIRELERQAEEEAMQRLIIERQEADAKRREAMKENEKIRQEEERKRQQELKKQAEEDERRRQQELEEEKRRMEELEKNAALKLWEERARDRVRRKIQSRRQYLLKIRDKNRERRVHLNSVRQTQGMTRPWVFSYYVHWPRDTYEKRLPSKKKDKRRMRPKPPPNPPGEGADQGQGGGTQMADSGA